MVIVMDLLKSISSLKTAITILAKHHGDSIVINNKFAKVRRIFDVALWRTAGGQ